MGGDVDRIAEGGDVTPAIGPRYLTEPDPAGVHGHADGGARRPVGVALDLAQESMRGLDGSTRMIRAGDTGDEEGDDAVTDHLLDDAAPAPDDVPGKVVEAAHLLAERRRGQALRQGRRAAHVGEQDRHLELAAAGR